MCTQFLSQIQIQHFFQPTGRFDRWTNGKPVVDALWNSNTGYFELWSVDIKTFKRVKVVEQEVLRLSALNGILQPETNNSYNQCIALVTRAVALPDWVTVSCSEPRFDMWICEWSTAVKPPVQKHIARRAAVECDTNWTLLAGDCVQVHVVNLLTNVNLSTIKEMCGEHHLAREAILQDLQNYVIVLKRYQVITMNYVVQSHNTTCLEVFVDNKFLLRHIGCNTQRPPRYVQVVCTSQVLKHSDKPCKHSEFLCTDGSCISSLFVCDGHKDCENDESICNCKTNSSTNDKVNFCRFKCKKPWCSCDTNLYQCISGGCIQYVFVCDGTNHCGDGSDEFCAQNHRLSLISTQTNFSDAVFHCNDGKIFPLNLFNDMLADCIGGDDEPEYELLLNETIPFSDKCQLLGLLSCRNGHSRCFSLQELCFYDTNEYGMKTCRHGEHLRFCKSFQCNNKYKCFEAYCIPFQLVCDGSTDCQHGDDETSCQYQSCPGLHKCHEETVCVHPSQICDGVIQCTQGDDEMFCNISHCPLQCNCLGAATSCKNIQSIENIMPGMHESLIYLSISHSYFTSINLYNSFMRNMIHFHISDTDVKSICYNNQLRSDPAIKLILFDVSRNKIATLVSNCFHLFFALRSLLLQNNQIKTIKAKAFLDQKNLTLLNISDNKVIYLSKKVFAGMYQLQALHLSKNPLISFDITLFDELPVKSVFTDTYHICCVVESSANCTAKKPWHAHCDDLLPNTTLRVFVWLITTAGLFFNLTSFLLTLSFEEKMNSFEVTKQCLSASDMMLTLTLVVTVVTDLQYKGTFVAVELAWRQSFWCKASAFLSLCCILMLCYTVSFITVSTYIVLAFPFCKYYKSTNFATRYLVLGFLINLVISLNAILVYTHVEKHSMMSNSLCIMHFSTGHSNVQFVTAILTAVEPIFTDGLMTTLFVAIFRIMKKSAELHNTKEKELNLKRSLKRMVLISVSHVLCWFPFCIVSILTWSGHNFPSLALAWLVLVVLPINSAANPFFYTFHSQKFRDFVKERIPCGSHKKQVNPTWYH